MRAGNFGIFETTPTLSLSLSLPHCEIEYLASVNFLFSRIRCASVMPDVSPLETLIALDPNERYHMSAVKIKIAIRNEVIEAGKRRIISACVFPVFDKSCVSSEADDIKIAT